MQSLTTFGTRGKGILQKLNLEDDVLLSHRAKLLKNLSNLHKLKDLGDAYLPS